MEHTQLWSDFKQRCSLTDHQVEQFKTYYSMLVQSNELFNLTAITELSSVIKYHFEDSLALGTVRDLSQSAGIIDVGSGAGFPGIPLKIKYPTLPVILVEVTHKKIEFLTEVIEALELSDIECVDLDWRTFLRKTEFPADIICARASLQPEELVRMFKPSSPYKDLELVYWAAKNFEPSDIVAPYIQHTVTYTVGKKERKLICMKLSS